jgi:cytoskeletal protein CcmA (bactofilin family)
MNKTTPPRRGLAGPDVAAGVRPGAGVLGLARPDSAGKTEPEGEPSTEGRLLVGEGIHVKGQIESCNTLIVEGKVEASLEAAELEVRKGGTYSGKAVVKSALVGGVFEGELTVDGLLTVSAGGRVGGTLRYRELKVEQGGRVSGDIDLLAEKAEKDRPTAEPAPSRRAEEAAREKLLEGAAGR